MDYEITTAIDSPVKLKNWLNLTGRRFLIFNADDLVDSLTFPGEIEFLSNLISKYRDCRRAQNKHEIAGKLFDSCDRKVAKEEYRAIIQQLIQLDDENKKVVK